MATDFRSDTVTRPTPEMRAAMAAAPVGDDVLGDDPTVIALEAEVAALLGFEAAVFLPSGTQSNLVGVMTHCARGDEYIVGQEAHTYRYEAGGAAVLGSVQPQPLEQRGGRHDPAPGHRGRDQAERHPFRADAPDRAREHDRRPRAAGRATRPRSREIADAHGLAMHLDGARLWNAAVKQGVPPRTIAQDFDSVSVCLSKGLGAPVGSVLCGGRDFIRDARRWRKMLGGGMRQAGIIAAAGRYAIAHNIARLAEDHENAARLAAGLARHAGAGGVARADEHGLRRRAGSHRRGVHRAPRGRRRPPLRHDAAALVHASRRRARGRRRRDRLRRPVLRAARLTAGPRPCTRPAPTASTGRTAPGLANA